MFPVAAHRPGSTLCRIATGQQASHRVDRCLYRGGRPNSLGRGLNRVAAVLAPARLPPARMVTLEVPSRSGRTIAFPLVAAEHDGGRYLVAMLGGGTNRVCNVEAAGGRAVVRHGRRRQPRLEQIPVADRAPALRRYLQLAPGARAHFPVTVGAELTEFERIAPDYPLFRIVPAG
ncbi:MAG TPA: nitroreductase family deazaflavin-dependent oxidoreductase [Mycobacteriales bacterium]|nr:nitroreductase family deazaflavin-dependent oxidoreductase [Mycobacteriales bacterium]